MVKAGAKAFVQSSNPGRNMAIRVAAVVVAAWRRTRAGLEALTERAPDIVLVHDAARPFTSAALVSRAIAAAQTHGAAVPALPVTDTVKLVDDDSIVTATLDRSHLRTVQTPQAFAYPAL